MCATIQPYATAVTTGDVHEISVTLHSDIIILPPGSNQPNEGKAKGAMMLSAVASVVADFKVVQLYKADEHSYIVSLAGSIDEIPVQFIDQVHLDENNLIDHMDIFLRPASMASILLGKVTEEIKKRTTKTQL